MKLINFALTATIALTATLSFLPSGGKAPDGYWENSDTYVYYTLEDITLQDGETVTLTFENRETREEYLFSEEYGNESITRNNARIIDVD